MQVHVSAAFPAMAALMALGCVRAPSPAACTVGRVAVHGACVEPSLADRQCGKAAHFVGGACVPRTCPGVQIIDQVTGVCLGARALRELGGRVHVVFEEGQTLGCHDQAVLTITNGHAACIPQVDGGAPLKSPQACGAGEVLDVSIDRCVRVVRDGAVDVAAWTRAVIGADGGRAAPELCARIGLDPTPFGLGNGAESALRVTVELVFPDNDVTQVHARTRTQADDGHSLPAASTSVTEDAVTASVDALRELGGTASAASVAVRVRCSIRAGFQPIAIDPPSPSQAPL